MFNPLFIHDAPLIFLWWAIIFLIGAAAFPITRRLFATWWDQGYSLSKAVGLMSVTWIVWQLGSYKVLPFSPATIIFSIIVVFGLGIALSFSFQKHTRLPWKKIVILELFFFSALVFWSVIKAHEPDIRSLEKFMDYGFSKTIQQTSYFPPADMWYAGGSINYYYFGHLVQALISTASGVHLGYGYNLMLASIFALCFTMSFSIGTQFYISSRKKEKIPLSKKNKFFAVCTGIIAAYLVSLSGNMQTIYAFTQGYSGENPPPFWNIVWKSHEFLEKLPEGINAYWYANATRFIPFTIHEFPSYSFVVSDNHGHVLSIPFVLLAIASLFTFFVIQSEARSFLFATKKGLLSLLPYGLYGSLCGVLLMTNALDGPIYMGIFVVFILVQKTQSAVLSGEWFTEKSIKIIVAVLGIIISSLPFLINFTSFASGLALNCPPAFLANSTIGPFIFESIDKCQRSPLWMMWLLWGFFWFVGMIFVLSKVKIQQSSNILHFDMTVLEKFVSILFIITVGLIVFAEVFYFKDIYPAHFRSNTMFKLGYQAFILSSLLVAFVIVHIFTETRKTIVGRFGRYVFFLLLIPQLFLVVIFPLFSVRSYFGNLETYKGLYGLMWFSREYPDDYKAMRWLEEQVVHRNSPLNWIGVLSTTDVHVHNTFFTSHLVTTPTILEADGDSYTDYNRMSAFSGLPTIVGWGVHEWLWRGTYDVVSPRKEEVRELYETGSVSRMRELINKYNITYVIIGTLERKKFTNIEENRFDGFGTIGYQSGQTKIYVLDKERN